MSSTTSTTSTPAPPAPQHPSTTSTPAPQHPSTPAPQHHQHHQRREEQALAAAGLTGTNIIGRPLREVIAPLAAQAAAGAPKVDVNTVLPLEQATDGLATIAGGKARGKSSSRSATDVPPGR